MIRFACNFFINLIISHPLNLGFTLLLNLTDDRVKLLHVKGEGLCYICYAMLFIVLYRGYIVPILLDVSALRKRTRN